ncbi:D-aminoacyl-tRNA deacylase [Halorubrum sp. DTA98]|uniref:D-aminoacyl-tRNA deacylase n=1 Tax=Halorubrum sp. DTA98 TaxID=3402163 RepID=UPI003AAC67DF
MIAIVVSRADHASEHIGEHLLELAAWDRHEDRTRPDGEGGGTYYRTDGFELRTFDDLHIHLDDPATAFGGDGSTDGDGDHDANRDDGGEPDALVFVSRHSGDTGALLTAHVTGNFGPAEYGGEPDEFARAAPGTEKRVVEALDDHAPEGYDVGIECTHHGPTAVSVPSLFVELGSDTPQWEDPDAARAVARAVLDLRGTSPDLIGSDGRARHVVGFGGGHYAPRFTRIVRDTEWAVGHVGADWGLAALGSPDANRAVIDRAFERSGAAHAVIEGDRPALRSVIEGLGHRVVSETWIREVGDRPLALVDAVEDALRPVDDGLRFGDVVPDPVRDADGDHGPFVVRELPAELLARAQGVDADATRTAVEASAVAFETEQAGTRAAGGCAFASDRPGRPDAVDLVADLAAVLEAAYDEVTVTDDAVIARVEAFDPALAAERGVPEGPAFGRLSGGEAVEVDGETIAPDDVSRTTEDRFPIDGPDSTGAK